MEDFIKKRVEIEIKKTYYTATRYKRTSTFALLYYEGELSLEQLGKLLRISDHLLKIDKNHYFINFIMTEHSDAFKASENLIFNLDKLLNNTTSCIAIDTFDPTQSPSIVLHRLTQILAETKKNSYSRIEDENILNEMF